MAKRKSRKNAAVSESEKNSALSETEKVELGNIESIGSAKFIVTETVLHFPPNTITKRKSLDFSELYNIGCDDVTYRLQGVIKELIDENVRTRGKSLSLSTIENYYVGAKVFLRFLEVCAGAEIEALVFSDIDESLVKQYLTYLSELGVSRNYYKFIKALLGYAGVNKSIFPKNPYPNSNRNEKGEKRLSKSERAQVAKAVKAGWNEIQNGKGVLDSNQLVTCFIGIALRTGMNPGALLELRTDCLLPHPLKSDRMVVVSYKRRGNKTNVTPVKRNFESATYKTALPDVIQLIELICQRNSGIRSQADHPDRLFVFSSRAKGARAGKILVMIDSHLHHGFPAFAKRYNLKNDSGETLQFNTMRLRKTYENRIWELSGGDPFMTAKAGGHSIKVSDSHYLEAPDDSEERLQFIGEARVKQLLVDDAEITPIAHCKDPMYGHRAPKNGKHCDAFLACFRCKSCVITGDDLHKLFSLYWMLIRERKIMNTRAWSRHFRHIIRIIDENISPQFGKEKVESAREKAKHFPHPYWKTLDQLGGLQHVY